MAKCYIDTETCGLHGMAVIIQYAFDDGPVQIHNFWTNPVDDSLDLLNRIADSEVIGFNLAFDWFMLCKMYTTLLLAKQNKGGDWYPDEDFNSMAKWEEAARNGPCFKPRSCFDLMLHARKTEFQITMERTDIRIKKVPTQLAWSLARELEQRVIFESILFARVKNKLAPKWKVMDRKLENGNMDTDFKDIVLKFKPSSGLKALAVHALKKDEMDVVTYDEVELPRHYRPTEYGYAPFAMAVGRPGKWNKAWPAVISYHIAHWDVNQQARGYAVDDVVNTRDLYKYFGCPPMDDDDSVLACMVAAVRFRGYAIDIPGIKKLKEEAERRRKEYPTAPRQVKAYISQVMGPAEQVILQKGTKKVLLEELAKQKKVICPSCQLMGEVDPNCEYCHGTNEVTNPAAERAQNVLDARAAGKEIELYDKLLRAGRLHASFKVIGTLSSRMAGADDLNAQGIKKTKDVRSKFPLAFGGLELVGGDFSGFEVVLAVAAFGDEGLERDLLTCELCRDIQAVLVNGGELVKETISDLPAYIKWRKKEESKKATPKTEAEIANESLKKGFACPKCGSTKRMKIHALFGTHVYPGWTYDQIKETDGGPGGVEDKYTKCKSAVFAMLYGGEGYTLQTRLGVPREVADAAYVRFTRQYPGVGKARERVNAKFCSIKQTGGVGSKIEWHEPAEYVESLLGFRRYFILENRIVETLFKLAENPPKEWKDLKVKVKRRDREQTVSGAVQSALFAACFGMQSANMRAAANHEIQSSGAQITKNVQRKIWDLQPAGCHAWLVQPCNIHDEILTPTQPDYVPQVREVVYNAVEAFRPRVPLIEMEWKAMANWAEKK